MTRTIVDAGETEFIEAVLLLSECSTTAETPGVHYVEEIDAVILAARRCAAVVDIGRRMGAC